MEQNEFARVASKMRNIQIKRDASRSTRNVREAAKLEAEVDRLLAILAESDPIVRANLGRPLEAQQLSLLGE